MLKDALEKVESEYGIPDLIVYLEETFPFRDVDLIDKMNTHMTKLSINLDSPDLDIVINNLANK